MPATARKSRLLLFAAGTLTVLLPFYGYLSLLRTMEGGLRGIAMLWLVSPAALGASTLALLSWRKSSLWIRIPASLVLILTFPAGAFITYQEIRSQIENPLQSLAPGAGSAAYRETCVVLRKNGKDCRISDPGSLLRFRYGASPASVEIKGGIRTVVFDRPVILKTWTDDVGLEEGGVTVGAWLGASTDPDRIRILIGPDGRAQTEPIP